MAYEITFTANITADNSDLYINDCCWGGDVIAEKLLPAVISGYGGMETGQEDWGWYIWMRHGPHRTHLDIFCDDLDSREFRIHLYGARRKLLRLHFEDGSDVERLKDVLLKEIAKWGTVKLTQRFTPDFMTVLPG